MSESAPSKKRRVTAGQRHRKRKEKSSSRETRSTGRTSQSPQRRSRSGTPSREESFVGLLRSERASGKAGAHRLQNQLTFMRLMGLVDGDPTRTTVSELDCPFSEMAANILVAASSHDYFPRVRQAGQNDGYLSDSSMRQAVGVMSEVPQCSCEAHERLNEEDVREDESDDLKMIIRTPPTLTADSGANFICALLRRLFKLMGLSCFRAERSGDGYSVSYILECNGNKYRFRGRPDFVVLKEDVGASQLLVSTGEIQSTNYPHVQNSIYAVGSLLQSHGKPVLCLTIYKWKHAQLSVAKITPTDHQDQAVCWDSVPQVCS